MPETEFALAAKNAAELAEFYRNYAGRFKPGTLGYLGNIAEAEKYARLAERYNELDEATTRPGD